MSKKEKRSNTQTVIFSHRAVRQICKHKWQTECCNIRYIQKRKTLRKIFNDGKTHVVYAGIFDPNKGVITAVDAARFLNGNYHIHILGFGKQSEIDYVKSKIEETAKRPMPKSAMTDYCRAKNISDLSRAAI